MTRTRKLVARPFWYDGDLVGYRCYVPGALGASFVGYYWMHKEARSGGDGNVALTRSRLPHLVHLGIVTINRT